LENPSHIVVNCKKFQTIFISRRSPIVIFIQLIKSTAYLPRFKQIINMFKKVFPAALFLIIPFIFFDANAQTIDKSELRVMHPPKTDEICTLEPTDVNAHFFIGPSREMDDRLKQATTSTFEVDYFIESGNACGATSWPDDAREAFDFAVDIWRTHLRSDVPIKIQAIWRNIESEPGSVTLGNAGPTRIVQPRQIDIGEPRTWYSIAQLSAMNGLAYRDFPELDGVDHDITVNINCSFDDWYFGTDASVPSGRTDFITVVLHEIGHGIGFIGSVSANNDAASGGWGTPENNPIPYIYDRPVVDGDFTSILNETVYPNPSGMIYSAVTGRRGGLFFEGEDTNNTLIEEEADRAKLYTPHPYRAGSSYSHVDQNTFTNTVNALMRPRIDRAMAIHTPGPLFCGMLSDMGWPLGVGCLSFLASDAVIVLSETEMNFGVTNLGEAVQKTVTITNDNTAIEPLSGAVETDNDNFTIIGENSFTLDPGQNTTITIQYNAEEDTKHTGTLSVIHNARNVQSPVTIPLKGETLQEDQIVKLDQSYPNPIVPTNPNPVIPYAISKDADVSLDLYTLTGQHLQSLVNSFQQSGRYEVEVDLQGLSSGLYIYRIVVDNVAKSGKMMMVN
jgi:hypothetical protein